jgi:hypothetical protein
LTFIPNTSLITISTAISQILIKGGTVDILTSSEVLAERDAEESFEMFEIFGISICLLHTLFAQRYYYNKINYKKYLKLSLIIIFPLSFITILIHELNILFLSFNFFTILLILIKNKFKDIINYKYLILLNFLTIILITYLLLTHPFTKEFSQELYNNLQNKHGTDFWIWESIAGSLSERLNYEIDYMLNPSGNVFLYFYIFLFYSAPIFFCSIKLLKKIDFI